jgi:hypothetical protein
LCDDTEHFQCIVSGKCIGKELVCNFRADCGGADESDETGCGILLRKSFDFWIHSNVDKLQNHQTK